MNALRDLGKLLKAEKNEQIITTFYRQRLVNPLTIRLEDQIEKCRELTIEILDS